MQHTTGVLLLQSGNIHHHHLLHFQAQQDIVETEQHGLVEMNIQQMTR